MQSLSLVMSECFLSGRGQGHVSNFYIVDLENFATASRRYTGDIHNSTVEYWTRGLEAGSGVDGRRVFPPHEQQTDDADEAMEDGDWREDEHKASVGGGVVVVGAETGTAQHVDQPQRHVARCQQSHRLTPPAATATSRQRILTKGRSAPHLSPPRRVSPF